MRNEEEIAIRIRGVKKEYRLGQIGAETLQKAFQSWWANKRGREDPNRRLNDRGRRAGDRFLALDGIDLTVRKGEALGIIGRNGAGKSTLLKILSRITAPTEGEAELFGKVTSMLEVGTGFHGELTGRENIYMNGAILGMTREQIRSRIDDIIAFSEVGEYIDTPVKRYSSGMYVKLAFAVAAHLRSEIMIMDEVLAVGDAPFQKKCLNQMKYAAEHENRTVLYVSHNMATIRELCSRCVVMDEGKIIYDGETEDAIRLYMDSGFREETEMDFSELERPDWLEMPKIRLLSAEYIGKDRNRFRCDEPLRLRLKWRNLKDIEALSLRVEIWSGADSPLATYVLYDFYQGKEGRTAAAELALDPGVFAEGRYYMNYSFFQRDPFGNMINVDNCKGLSFEITAAKHTGKLNWEAKYWGNIVLEDIRMLSLKEGGPEEAL